jgi:hypothetical protein
MSVLYRASFNYPLES